MSREQQEQWRWLGGLRLAVSLLLLFTLVGLLASAYQSHRRATLEAAMGELVAQFGERSQRLHGLWLMERRPPSLWAEGRRWHFSAQGWPRGAGEEGDPCRALWLAMTGIWALDGEALTLRQQGEGCEFSLSGAGWRYGWQDGALERVESDGAQR